MTDTEKRIADIRQRRINMLTPLEEDEDWLLKQAERVPDLEKQLADDVDALRPFALLSESWMLRHDFDDYIKVEITVGAILKAGVIVANFDAKKGGEDA